MRMTTYFKVLPHEICHEISKFLDYESRMNYNMTIDFEDRHVTRLNSDKHNKKVKADLVMNKMDKLNRTECYTERAKIIANIYKYLTMTKDTALLSHEKFRKTVLERSKYHSYREDYPEIEPSVRASLKFWSQNLVSKIENGFT